MNTKFRTTVDKSGRIALPPEIVGELHLEPGSVLSIQEKDGKITLEPISEDSPRLIEKEGILVQHAQLTNGLFKTIDTVRSKRIADLFEDNAIVEEPN